MLPKNSRKDFLQALFDDYFQYYSGFIVVKAVSKLEHKSRTRYFPSVDLLAKQEYFEDENVFFSVCPRESMKPRAGSACHLPALWAGLDFSASGHSGRSCYTVVPRAALAVRLFPLPPSAIVESGRGLHMYWLLKNITAETDVATAEKLLRQINLYFQCPGVISVDSMMRLPDTSNAKMPGDPLRCQVKYLNAEFRYSLEDFEKLDQRYLSPPSAHPAPRPAARSETGAPSLRDDETLVLDESLVEVVEDSVENLGQTSPDELAERVALKVVEKLKEELVDEIVDRLVKRLRNPR